MEPIAVTIESIRPHLIPIEAEVDPADARTQKARGIAALARSFPFGSVPPFRVHRASAVRPEALLGCFARPCPMRPRHGFVDSRVIHNLDESTELIEETVQADPEAEIVTMPKIDAAHSGVWTPGMLVVGRGHDGATAGTSAWTVPALGQIVSKKLESDAGVNEAPYVELLWKAEEEKPHQLVQLRDGPKLHCEQDYVPQKRIVTRILVAAGDLLAWEDTMRSAEIGTVVYHPNGSMASHYAIHAVLNHVPVLVSREPVLGEVLEPTSSEAPRDPDLDALRAGYTLAAQLQVTYVTAAHIMLAGCHHISVWSGRHDTMLGLAMGMAYRLTVIAALAEMRHAPDTGKRKPGRDSIYDGSWATTHTEAAHRDFERALEAFHGQTWCRNYGGAKWFFFARWAALMQNALLERDASLALQAFNQLVHCAHNTGWAFNKFLCSEALTITADNPVFSLVRCAPLLYEANRRLAKDSDQLSDMFGAERQLISIPSGEPNDEVTEPPRDDERRHYMEERRSEYAPAIRRRVPGIRLRSRGMDRPSARRDVPFF